MNIVGYRQKSDWNTPKEVYNEIVETAKNLPSDTIPYRYAMSNPYYNRNMANSLTSIDSFISTVDNGIVEFYDSIRSHRHTMTNDGPDGTNELNIFIPIIQNLFRIYIMLWMNTGKM